MKNRNQKSEVRSRKLRLSARTWLAFLLVTLVALVAPFNERQISAALNSEAEPDGVELYQSLLDLQNPWTVMCVAAHPDDEDGATLTVLRRKYGVHTVTLFSTYGEGGQNAIGPELYEELGAMRARETMKASEIQGSEPYFLGLPDFGFSKSAEEAFRVWGHDEALRRMVLKIRELRPDVIITNHDTQSGHGHHQATGRLILEAFDAAADARRFPDQLRWGLRVWQAQRLFVRVNSPGGNAPTASEAQDSNVVSINRNDRDSARNQTYAEQALRALQQHATQGPWPQTVPANWATTAIRYRLTRSAKNVGALPANAQTFLDGLTLPPEVTDKLKPSAMRALLPQDILPQDLQNERLDILTALVNARKNRVFAAPVTSSENARFQLMGNRLNRAFAVASGIKATITPQSEVLIPGTTTKVSLKISNTGERDARIWSMSTRGLQAPKPLRFPLALARGQVVTIEMQSAIPPVTSINLPHAEHLYDGKLLGEELAALIHLEINGAAFLIDASTRVDVAPAAEIAKINPSPIVITPATIERPAVFTLRVTNHQATPFAGVITDEGLPSHVWGPLSRPLELAANETREVEMTRNTRFQLLDPVEYPRYLMPEAISFRVSREKGSTPLTKRDLRTIWADARVAPNVRVGYIRSFDDTLRDSLAALGVEAKALTVNDVQTGNLQSYQAIIIDNRGYQAHPELVAANSRLLDYVSAGGTLIVFYHRTNEWNPDPKVSRPQLAPYPLTLGSARVTDETAGIEFLEPAHPLLNYPNKITPADFSNWIQERGLYYPEKWDSHYKAILTTHDPGEASLPGGLLAADYGRGRYIYTSMVWYRQLRAGVPGAYRVLANMISYGR